MALDPVLLARLQFAFTMSFHFLFPSFTIGLAWWLVALEALWLATGKSGSRKTARATANASIGSDLPRVRADARVRAIRCGGTRTTR